MVLYKTVEGLHTMHETINDFTELSERFVSILRNLVKSAEPKKVVNKGHEIFFLVPNLKWVGSKVVNLHSSVINRFVLECRLTGKIIFQQDGASIHFAKAVRSLLNEKFGDRWIGRGGNISWASRLSDLTPLDFFFMGSYQNKYLQNKNKRSRRFERSDNSRNSINRQENAT